MDVYIIVKVREIHINKYFIVFSLRVWVYPISKKIWHMATFIFCAQCSDNQTYFLNIV